MACCGRAPVEDGEKLGAARPTSSTGDGRVELRDGRVGPRIGRIREGEDQYVQIRAGGNRLRGMESGVNAGLANLSLTASVLWEPAETSTIPFEYARNRHQRDLRFRLDKGS